MPATTAYYFLVFISVLFAKDVRIIFGNVSFGKTFSQWLPNIKEVHSHPPPPPPQGKICSLPLSLFLSPPAVVVFINTSESCYCREEGKYRREEKGKYPVVIVSVVFVNGWKVYGSLKCC